MKRILALMLVLVMLCSTSAGAYQWPEHKVIKTYVKSTGIAMSGIGTRQAVSTSTISPSDKILGFTLIANGQQGGGVGLYDAANAQGTPFAEAEVTATVASSTILFPYAKQVSTQLTILMSSADLTVIIYYEDV